MADAPGNEITIRPATTEDVAGIAELFSQLSERSARLRFSHTLDEEQRWAYAELTKATTSLVAVHDAAIVAEARYVTAGGTPPELAMTVADSHQGRGLGTRLLDALRSCAREDGVVALRAVVRTDNQAMLRLLRTTSTAIVAPVEESEVAFDLATDAYMPPWPTGGNSRKVLIETRTLLDTPEVQALWEAGLEVRKCMGPNDEAGRSCPALEHGLCRLADDADLVVTLLPESDRSCRLIADDHAEHRTEALVARTQAQWRAVASGLARED